MAGEFLWICEYIFFYGHRHHFIFIIQAGWVDTVGFSLISVKTLRFLKTNKHQTRAKKQV